MDFTVLIASRNRATLLDRAIKSVLEQQHESPELLVINDGSSEQHEAEYRMLERRYAERVRFLHLDPLSAPHGKSRALNIALKHAQGGYVAFLDDDDYWLPSNHLRLVREAIVASGGMIDVFLFNQEANGSGMTRRDLWLAALAQTLASTSPDKLGMYPVTPALLLEQPGFCHMNTIIARKQTVLDCGGFDESLRYEVDRDFYVRLIDRAQAIAYSPEVTSCHTIPDPSATDNMSTQVTSVEKLLNQLSSFNKNLLAARRPEVRRHLRLWKRYALKDLAIHLHHAGDEVGAFHFAREALLIGLTWKWVFYCAWLGLRSLGAQRGPRP